MIRRLILRILANFTIAFFSASIMNVCGHSCTYKNIEGLFAADCSNRGLQIDVPTDLDYNMQFLNISFNRLTYIDTQSFKNYPDLIRVEMQHMEKNSPLTFDEDCFLCLTKLEYIDVSYSCTNTSIFIWPPSLKILKIENCPIAMHLNNLPNLTELYAAYSGLAGFPDFHKQAPVTFVDIRGAPLFSFTPLKIAPFCKLRRLILEVKPQDGIQESGFYCNCLKVQAWFLLASIEAEPLNCTLPQNNIQCNETNDLEAIEARHECLGIMKISNSTTSATSGAFTKTFQNMVFLVIGAIIFVGILGILFMYATRKITRKLSGKVVQFEQLINEQVVLFSKPEHAEVEEEEDDHVVEEEEHVEAEHNEEE